MFGLGTLLGACALALACGGVDSQGSGAQANEADQAASTTQAGGSAVTSKPSIATGGSAPAADGGRSGGTGTQQTAGSAGANIPTKTAMAAAGSPAAGSGGMAASAPPVQMMSAAAGMPAAGSGSAATSPRLPSVTSTDGAGPFMTMMDLQSGPKQQSGLFRPDELGKDGLLHPVFVWGCGGQSTPSSYSSELNQIASHGFVVIAEVEEIGDNGAPLLAALDWITAENARPDSMLFHKLDTSHVGLGGHSIGSVNSFFAGTDPRWTTTLHVAGGSLDNVNDPSAPTTGKGGKALIHPTAYICSANDIFGNVEKTQKDYDNTTVPVFFTILEGAEHIGAVGEALPVIIGWLRWQLAGEEERRMDFLDPQGMFSTGRYMTHTKNW